MKKTSINISEIIGKTITDIRYKLEYNVGDLDYFESYITLNSKITINFPFNDGAHIVKPKGKIKKLDKELQKLLIGFTIIDILIPYFNDKVDESEKPFLQLNNSMFIKEINTAPHGTGAADLWIYNINEFKNKLTDNDLRSITGNKITM